MNNKIQKILATVAFIALLGVNTEITFAQQIPAGYALVPISALTGTQNFAYPQTSAPQNYAPTSVANVSGKYSTLRASENFGFVNGASLQIVATLRDETGEPLAGRVVNLVGSRALERVQAIQPSTDQNGEAIFSVIGGDEGVATFTAIDQATGTSVTERPRVIFLNQQNSIGGDPATLRADLIAQTPSTDTPSTTTTTPVNYKQKIEVEFPTTTAINQPRDIKVSLTDNNGVVLDNYTGTINFTSGDPQAKLPKSYTYKNLDRGTHIFSNAVTFYTPGMITLRITADTDTEPSELTINVSGASSTSLAVPMIQAPTNNSTTNKTLTVSGTATPNSNLAVLIDDKISAQVSSDTDGKFSTELTELEEGEHTLKVALLGTGNSISAVSATVNFVFDKTPPTLETIVFAPGNEVEAKTKVTVKVTSEKDLASAKLSVNGKTLTLKTAEEGAYTGEIQTNKPNTYSFDLELVDRAGNVANLEQVATLTVKLPTTISNVQAKPKSKQVALSWDPPENQPDVNHYVIAYGPVENNLTKKFETTDNRVLAVIENLNNNTTYYFQVFSVDASGNPNGQSDIANAVPTAFLELRARACDTKVILDWLEQDDPNIVRYQIAYGTESDNHLENQNLPDARTHWEVRNLINNTPYYFTIRGLDIANNVVFDPDEEVTATPGGEVCLDAAGGPPNYPIQLWQKQEKNGQTILVWNDVPDATSYRVYAGTEPNYFNLPVVTVTTPYLRPTGLDPKQNYYFAVRAVYGNAEGNNFSNVLEVKVGPALIAALALIFAASVSYWIQRRKLEHDC